VAEVGGDLAGDDWDDCGVGLYDLAANPQLWQHGGKGRALPDTPPFRDETPKGWATRICGESDEVFAAAFVDGTDEL